MCTGLIYLLLAKILLYILDAFFLLVLYVFVCVHVAFETDVVLVFFPRTVRVVAACGATFVLVVFFPHTVDAALVGCGLLAEQAIKGLALVVVDTAFKLIIRTLKFIVAYYYFL